MSTLTTRLGLYKPAADGSELVNVVTDLNNNMDSLDAKVGAFACTSGTRPASPFNGQFIRETDTGKMYCCSNTVGPVWTQVLFGTAQFANSINTTGKLQSTGAGAGLVVDVMGSSSDIALLTNVTGDTQDRFRLFASGLQEWGPGGATTRDTNLYRAGANILKTDDAFQVVGALTVTGAASLSDATLSGSLNIGSGRYRNQLSTPTTVANTTTETVIGSMTIPANDAAVGAIYRIHIAALASVALTPTLTLRARIGGAAGALVTATGIAITAASNGTNHHWFADLDYTIVSTGAGGTARGFLKAQEAMSLGGASPFTGLVTKCDGGLATAAHDTTAAKDLVITVQWSAASASNTTTAFVVTAERVA